MNIDAKIINKIHTSQIKEHVKMIIHHNQVEFNPGLLRWFNIQKSVNIIHYINKGKEKKHDHYMMKKPHFMLKILERSGIQDTHQI